MSTVVAASDKQQLVDEVGYWWHSIDLGDGVITPGWKSPRILQRELANFRLPNLAGRTVLDIGAWDGYFSFQAERLGAERVVALDHFAWSIDRKTRNNASRRRDMRVSEKLSPDQNVDCWRPDELPGRRGFDLAREKLGSEVEPVVADFMKTDLAELGQFDVVLFSGVLYHMRHPLLALERLAQVTGELAVIETAAVWTDRRRAWCEFFETNELGNDHTNWWTPNEKALIGMCRAAGFRRVDILVRPTWSVRFKSRLRRATYRLFAHAYK